MSLGLKDYTRETEDIVPRESHVVVVDLPNFLSTDPEWGPTLSHSDLIPDDCT